MKLEFSKQIFGKKKKTKIRPVGAELFHADRLADTTKLTVALGNSTNALKKYSGYREVTADVRPNVGNFYRTSRRHTDESNFASPP